MIGNLLSPTSTSTTFHAGLSPLVAEKGLIPHEVVVSTDLKWDWGTEGGAQAQSWGRMAVAMSLCSSGVGWLQAQEQDRESFPN